MRQKDPPNLWCPDPSEAAVDDAGHFVIDQPLAELIWFSPDGVRWRQRRSGLLDARRTRQILADRHPRVFHVYDSYAHEHTGPGLHDLIRHLDDYWAGRLHSMAFIDIGEFRSASGDSMLMVQETC